MKNKITYFLALLLVSNFIIAQTPCTNGFAGEYPCNNYDLLSNIPVSILANGNNSANGASPEGSDIWGWTDNTTSKEYAIVAMTNSTAFVDVSNPLNPIFLGRLDSNAGNNFWRDVKIYNDFAFIVADNVGAHGMQVFDLKKLRNVTTAQNFTADAIYNTDNLGSCHNVFINENNGVAYLVGCKNASNQRIFSGGPIFVDISNPTNPVKLGGYSDEGYTHDVQVVNYNGPDSRYTNKEIFIGSNENKIVVLDVTDKANITKISQIDYSQIGYTHQGWFTEDQRYFILGDETDEQNFGMNTRTLVFDFSDLQNPTLSSTYFGSSSAIDHNGYVKNNEFFMASYRAGLRVLDITNIAAATNSMTEIGFFDTYPADNRTAFNGAWSVYPYFESGNIIINDIERGLFVVRKSGTLSTKNNAFDKQFSLFPNPANNKTTIKSKSSENINSITVFNSLGQKIFEKLGINTNEYNLDVTAFSNGIYFIKINNIQPQKIVIN